MTEPAKPYVYEFLYRGRPPGSAEPAAYHVILAKETDVVGRSSTVLSHALTPAQAKAQGFGLPDILTIMNAEALQQIDELNALVTSTKADLEAALKEAGDLRERLARAEAASAEAP